MIATPSTTVNSWNGWHDHMLQVWMSGFTRADTPDLTTFCLGMTVTMSGRWDNLMTFLPPTRRLLGVTFLSHTPGWIAWLGYCLGLMKRGQLGFNCCQGNGSKLSRVCLCLPRNCFVELWYLTWKGVRRKALKLDSDPFQSKWESEFESAPKVSTWNCRLHGKEKNRCWSQKLKNQKSNLKHKKRSQQRINVDRC